MPNFIVSADSDLREKMIKIQDQFHSGENYREKRARYVNGKMCPADVICKIAIENGNRLHVRLVTSWDGQLKKERIFPYGKNCLDEVAGYLRENITWELKDPSSSPLPKISTKKKTAKKRQPGH